MLFEQGDRGDLIYVDREGRDRRRASPRADGSEELLATLGPDDYFGEMGPLFGLPRSATARAAEPTTVTGYSVKDFRDRLGIERLGDIVSIAQTRA